MEKRKKKLVLLNGDVYLGEGFGADREAIGELVFNTSMTGYQEIVSDPSYVGQMIVMSYPLIGNYGVTDEDYESKTLTLSALIVREYNDNPSNFRYTKTLGELLEENNIPAIEGIDTRKLVRSIRDFGNTTAILTDAETSDEEALAKIKAFEQIKDTVKITGCKKRWYSRTPNHRYNVVAVDCGIKHRTVRALNALGCNVTMVPYNISAEEVLNLRPDGLYLSDGPDDPENIPEIARLIDELKGKLPIMGIGLGHQLIALAYGAKTYKMKFGHRGANHPVRDAESGRIEVTVQNHGFAVDAQSVDGTGLEITHYNVLDSTVEGLEDKRRRVFSLQFEPETAQGPCGCERQFEKFIRNIEEFKNAQKN